MRTRRWPLIGVALALLWLLVRGVALDPNRLLEEFLIGLAFGLPIAYVLRRFYRPDVDVGQVLRGVPYGLVYVALFLRELTTANLEVAYRVLSPSMPIDPGVIEVPLRVETDLAIATIANSITLTPGTLTMDYDEATNTLYVHGIAVDDPEAVVAPIRAWEDYALRIFDEAAHPSDPAPPRPSERANEARDDGAAADAGGEADG
ncbi:MAG: Na+/H+ antiporter subunit E [Haloarculaceae archaeon]